jgi:hypothetical protein
VLTSLGLACVVVGLSGCELVMGAAAVSAVADSAATVKLNEWL